MESMPNAPKTHWCIGLRFCSKVLTKNHIAPKKIKLQMSTDTIITINQISMHHSLIVRLLGSFLKFDEDIKFSKRELNSAQLFHFASIEICVGSIFVH